MIEGLLITLVTLNAFVAGFILGKNNDIKPNKTKSTAKTEASSVLITPQQKQEEELQRKQEKAFRAMLDYNTNIAYGVTKLGEEVDT